MNFVINNALEFWNRYKDDMIEDFRRRNRALDLNELYNLALLDLNKRFLRVGKECLTFGLPNPIVDHRLLPRPVPLVQIPPAIQVPQAIQVPAFALNPAQQHGFDRIIGAARRENNQRCFVVIGPGGSGKTTLYKQIIETCKAENKKVAAFATTGIAATLMEGGMTVHSGFCFPPELNADATSKMQLDRNMARCKPLREANIILIDEITMMVQHGLRIIDGALRNIMQLPEIPFGGKVIVVGGDFRQLLPVVPGGSRPQIISECVISSPLWKHFEIINLRDNMRAQGDPEFVDWLLRVGTGSLDPIPEIAQQNVIEIPQDMLLTVPPQPPREEPIDPNEMPPELRVMIDHVFGNDIAALTSEELASKAILASTVNEVMKVNNHIIMSMDGDARHYLSLDRVLSQNDQDQVNFPAEYINAQQPSGLPPHDLALKVNTVVLLLRNMDPEQGLSNGTKLMVKQLLPHAIVAEILSESHRGETVFIARHKLDAQGTLPVKIERLQFPLIPAYAMTINKSQGQTLETVGIYLKDIVFSHGQLYVALSRCRNRNNIKVFVKDQGSRQGHLLRHIEGQRDRVFTRNMVYREVFVHRELRIFDDPEIEALALQAFQDEEDEEIERQMAAMIIPD
jgi:energy-coupling factor transporter ATP-binding protein EcfA2